MFAIHVCLAYHILHDSHCPSLSRSDVTGWSQTVLCNEPPIIMIIIMIMIIIIVVVVVVVVVVTELYRAVSASRRRHQTADIML